MLDIKQGSSPSSSGETQETPDKLKRGPAEGMPCNRSHLKWCLWCGDNLPERHQWMRCGIPCINEEIQETIRRPDDHHRLSGLYSVRARMIKKEERDRS